VAIRPRIRVEVDAAALRRFAQDLPQVRDTVQAVAGDIAAEARRLAPVGHDTRQGHRPGTLRDSIGTERPLRKGSEGDTVRVVARVYYAQFVELGTRNMSPRPFLRPAAAKYRQNRSQHFARVVRTRARRAARRAAASG
jgi:HK97 gp10 family phage protein